MNCSPLLVLSTSVLIVPHALLCIVCISCKALGRSMERFWRRCGRNSIKFLPATSQWALLTGEKCVMTLCRIQIGWNMSVLSFYTLEMSADCLIRWYGDQKVYPVLWMVFGRRRSLWRSLGICQCISKPALGSAIWRRQWRSEANFWGYLRLKKAKVFKNQILWI